MKILVSIPVHEEPEVVCDQVRNIVRFVPGSVIVLHLSKMFPLSRREMLEKVAGQGSVLINTRRLRTGWVDGSLWRVHLANFAYADGQVRFDYIALHASNDLFVASGVEAYMSQFDAGVFQTCFTEESPWFLEKRQFRDRTLRRMMGRMGINDLRISQVEGSFYRREVFRAIYDVMIKHRPWVQLDALYMPSMLRRLVMRRWPHVYYPKEELYPATLSAGFAEEVGYPYCYMDWTHHLCVTKEVVDAIRCRRYECLENVAMPDGRLLFAVKRVARSMRDPLRSYIRELPL